MSNDSVERCSLIPEIEYALKTANEDWWNFHWPHMQQCPQCRAEIDRMLKEHPEYKSTERKSGLQIIAEGVRDLAIGFTTCWIADDLFRRRR